MNLELRNISDWALKNKLKFNEYKSKVMLMSRTNFIWSPSVETYPGQQML
jgi:hypothetical protein